MIKKVSRSLVIEENVTANLPQIFILFEMMEQLV